MVCNRDGVGIIEHGNGLGHPHAMLPEVNSGFAVFIPLEGHNSIVHTRCAYVNRPEIGLSGRRVALPETAGWPTSSHNQPNRLLPREHTLHVRIPSSEPKSRYRRREPGHPARLGNAEDRSDRKFFRRATASMTISN
jgi:hypothetical protein